MKESTRFREIFIFVMLLFVYEHFGDRKNSSLWVMYYYTIISYFPFSITLRGFLNKKNRSYIREFYIVVAIMLLFNYFWLWYKFDMDFKTFYKNLESNTPEFISSAWFILMSVLILIRLHIKHRIK